MTDALKRAEAAIFEPLGVAPTPWRGEGKVKLTVWRQPSFDPYASWSVVDAGETWVRRVVAEQRVVLITPIDIDVYCADAPMDSAAALELINELSALAAVASPPRPDGVVIDGMRLGARAAGIDIQWQSFLRSPFNDWWANARAILDARMPACTIPIQVRHGWIDAPD